VLWLLSGMEAAQVRLREFAKARGIDPERLIFAGKLVNPEHLARYPLADLFLDCLPYGAHTTASDALWMGVPVLTLSGRSFASRVCGSLVRSAGLPELVCSTAEEFVDHAVALGRDRSMLQQYRDRLTAGRDSCTLFDTPKLVRCLEALYAEMWSDFTSGKLPRPDLTNLDAYLEVGIEHAHETEEVLAIKDYQGWWRERLQRRNLVRPLQPDTRLFKP
jgi:predicted O-linked N-acetylglucosamine transferase (SPINDLY family)